MVKFKLSYYPGIQVQIRKYYRCNHDNRSLEQKPFFYVQLFYRPNSRSTVGEIESTEGSLAMRRMTEPLR